MTQQTNARAKCDPTNTASSAANECHPVATDANAIVRRHAEQRPIESAGARGRDGDGVTLPNGKRHKRGICQHCGGVMIIKRDTGPKRKKYCSVNCRVAAHRRRKLEEVQP